MGEFLCRRDVLGSASLSRQARRGADVSGWYVRVRRIRDRLREAFGAGRMGFAYQPIVGRDDGVFYHECLLRAVDCNGMPFSPSEFIPILEQLGEIGWLDRLTMLLVLMELEGAPRDVLGCNMSGQSLSDPIWMRETIELLSARRVLAERFIVEITGVGADFDLAVAAESVAAMRGLGVRVALDNFGGNVLSGDDLRALGVDIVKFDRRLIEAAAQDRTARDHLAALAANAHSLGLLTVAEGVCNAQQFHILDRIGIRFFQGFGVDLPSRSRVTKREARPDLAEHLAAAATPAASHQRCREGGQ